MPRQKRGWTETGYILSALSEDNSVLFRETPLALLVDSLLATLLTAWGALGIISVVLLRPK